MPNGFITTSTDGSIASGSSSRPVVTITATSG